MPAVDRSSAGLHSYRGRHRASSSRAHRVPIAAAALATGVLTTTLSAQLASAAPAVHSATTRLLPDHSTPARTVGYTGSPKLVKGAHGIGVRYLQARLGVPVTGRFTASTYASVKAFQRTHNLSVTGVADVPTWRLLPTVKALPVVRVSRSTVRASVGDGLNWDALARCESGGNPRAYNPAGYYGLYQFTIGTWHGVGGEGVPSNASADEQTYRAQLLYARRGSSPWPACGHFLHS